MVEVAHSSDLTTHKTYFHRGNLHMLADSNRELRPVASALLAADSNREVGLVASALLVIDSGWKPQDTRTRIAALVLA